MSLSASSRRRARHRDLLFFASPHLWPHWPLLPVVRDTTDAGVRECGLLYDARGRSGICGYSATVFLANLFLLPATEGQLLNGPKHVYDTVDELADDGWVVD